MPRKPPPEPSCEVCHERPIRVHLGDQSLCDDCFDVVISATTGWPRLPAPPPPEMIRGPDGRRHRISYRIWRSPGGVVVEANEGERGAGGYEVKDVGQHDADVPPLLERVRRAIRRRIEHLDLERSPHGDHWLMADMELRGRLVWQEGSPVYGVVVDGRELTWEEFGLALEAFAGWEFRLRIVEGIDDDGEEPEGSTDADDPRPPEFDLPQERHLH